VIGLRSLFASRLPPPLADLLKRILRRGIAKIGVVIVVLYALAAIFAPLIQVDSPISQNLQNKVAPPSLSNPFGTDELGRDLYSRIIWGTRLAFEIGIVSTGFALTVGVLLGVISGYYGGRIDTIIMRLVDAWLSFPFLLMALVIVVLVGPSLTNTMIAIGVELAPRYARLTRGLTLSIREKEFILAARMSGERDTTVITRYIIPNCVSTLVVQSTFDFPRAVIASAALSFLGLGAQPPTPEWGVMISTGRNYLLAAPHLTIFPGTALFFLALGFNLFGDVLRDVLDPRLRE